VVSIGGFFCPVKCLSFFSDEKVAAYLSKRYRKAFRLLQDKERVEKAREVIGKMGSLQKRLHTLAGRDGIFIDQFIAAAAEEKMAALMTEAYLEERAERSSPAKYEAALAPVPHLEPEPYDQTSPAVSP